MTRRLRAAVVYQHLPHYRHGVFMAMQNSRAVQYEFAADFASRDGSIPTVPPTLFEQFARLRNIWIGPFLWQAGLSRILMRKKKFDAVIFLGDFAYLSSWIWALYCRFRKTRVLFWTIGWHREEFGVRKWLRGRFYHLADELLLYSDAGKELGIRAGFPAQKMRVIGNSCVSSLGVADNSDEEQIGQIERLLPARGHPTVAAVVRIDAQRQFELLLEAVASLNRDGIDVSVLLVGQGREVQALQQLATRLNVDLRMLGPVYATAHLRLVYERISMTVVPRKAGLTVIQSMSFGKPVITTDKPEDQGPEVKAISAGITGDFFSDNSVDSLKETIRRWLVKTSEHAESIAEQCQREVAANWTPERQASAIANAVAHIRGVS